MGPITCVVQTNLQLDLSKHGLVKVPSDLPWDTQYLDLSYNNITYLYKGNFGILSELCVLKISHNSLKDISPSAFQDCPRLQLLDISFNALKTIPDLPLTSLRFLDLSENLYNSYRLGESYRSLVNINSLALGSPWARSVKVTDFSPLSAAPLRSMQLGAGHEIDGYELSSFTCLLALRELTLKMSFCQKPELLKDILQDLDKIDVNTLTLIKFVPNQCNVSRDIGKGFKGMNGLLNLTFKDTWFSSSVLTKVVFNIIQSSVQTLSFLNITFAQDTSEGVQIHSIPGYNNTVHLKVLSFDTIHHHQYNFPLISINATLFPHLTHLKFSVTGISIIPCNLISALPLLKVLDLSDNLLHDHGLWWPACSFAHVFPSLKELYLRNNKFKNLQFISNHTYEMPSLDTLDLGSNVITLRKNSWPPHLTNLALSSNVLGDAVFDHLSPFIQTLNLTQTGIMQLTQNNMSQLTALRQLFLSFNNIKSLPDDLSMPQLVELHVDQNSISTFHQRAFEGLTGLRRLKAGNNPFACNCDLYWFVTSFNKTLLIDWPLDYACYSPPDLAGMALEKYLPSRLSCDPWAQAAVAVMTILVVLTAAGAVFYAFDGAWYLQMLWVWIRVKRRSHQRAQRLGEAFEYHVFISYSQKDSQWVDTQLVPYLEGEQLKLCVHERDFTPGHWIIDNIIRCVEQSYKTLFVLSNNFVQSEWCNYELFFAQHWAMGIQQDSLVFILLEPIPADSLPKKFLKLRKLLWQQTYLEWPGENSHRQTLFWTRVKALLKVSHQSTTLERVAKEVASLCPLLNDTD
ncbi:toll-like receptor 1-like [Scleropages formosus]|uniref:Toll-like receptor 1-like n=1 Tax=Scleropages formosus TaxID=113540 RepID=A0A0N8JZ72_SCLFO|nr:toll-like receptor 1-like [Scleropages formosus]